MTPTGLPCRLHRSTIHGQPESQQAVQSVLDQIFSALRRYGNEGDDRSMVASRAQIEAEERRSLRAGRAEDERDAEAEARARAAKVAKKERARKRPKAGGAELFMA